MPTIGARLASNGRPLNGGLQLTVEVHCAICEKANLGLMYPLKKAEDELHHEGWRKVQGLWICQDHED